MVHTVEALAWRGQQGKRARVSGRLVGRLAGSAQDRWRSVFDGRMKIRYPDVPFSTSYYNFPL